MVEVEINVPESRTEKSKERLTKAYECKEPDRVPVVVGSAGRVWPVSIKYHNDQELKFWRHFTQTQLHFANVDDDSIPVLVPYFGLAVLPSAFRAKILWFKGQDPKIDESRPVITSPEDVDDLEVPDPYHDGLMPTVLKVYEEWKKRTNVPIGLWEGGRCPFFLAVQLRGKAKLFLDMYKTPDLVHKLMKVCTETVIEFTKVEKKTVGRPMDHSISNEGGVWAPRGIGISLDACDHAAHMSAEMFKEFVLPYVEEIAKTFKGALIHGCGDHSHQCENYLNMPHVKAIHVNLMGNLSILRRFKQKLGNRKCIIAGDSIMPDSPLIDEYFKELIKIGAPGGNLIVNPRPYMDTVFTRSKNGKKIYIQREELHHFRIPIARQITKVVRRYGKFPIEIKD